MNNMNCWKQKSLVFTSFSRNRTLEAMNAISETAKKADMFAKFSVKYKFEDGALRRDLYVTTDIRREFRRQRFFIVF